MKNLQDFLKQKGQEYAPFDPNRAKRIFILFQKDFLSSFKPKVIHIVGTNGKGSTGRYIALGLKEFKVLHFSSPHLFEFNERFYWNGENVSYKLLEEAHQILSQKPYMQEVSYFEYATFLALFLAKDLDYLIFEAGLGGEFDSTNVITHKISVFVQIGFDHTEILGESIEAIAKTKLKSMGQVAFLGIQKYPQVKEIAQSIAREKHARLECLSSYEHYSHCADFLSQNFALAQKVLRFLGVKLEVMPSLDLMGRMQKIRENIWLDVGHNLDGAEALKQELRGEKIILVYNAYVQKNIQAILACLKENIEWVEIIEVKQERIIPKERLMQILKDLQIPFRDFLGFQKEKKYLVFGSFSVVKEALGWLKDEK